MHQPPAHLFKPGQSGNPAGRRKGSRGKLANVFFDHIHALWEEQGEAVLRRAAFEKPMEFAAMVAKLMPAKLEITTPTSGLSDERFQELMDLAERQLALAAGLPASMTIEGHAIEVEGVGGSPHDGMTRGEVIEVVHYSAEIPDDLLSISPSERDAPTTTPSSTTAETPTEGSMGNPIDLQMDEEVDVDALFR